MTSPHPIERHAINDAALFAESAARIPRVLANLADNLPDSPGHSTGGAGYGGSPVEAAHARRLLDDLAVRDWARLQEIDRLRGRLAREEFDLTSRWMFATVNGSERHSRPTSDEDWCRSCLRIDWLNPRSRGDLCDWCYRYVAAEGEQPPLELITARRDGKRITTSMVADVKRHAKIRRKQARR